MLLLALALIALQGVGLASVQSVKPVSLEVAQDPRWTQFTPQTNGLRSDNIWTILADGGSVWFGGEGITRFDGA